jgi:hypothetical protein
MKKPAMAVLAALDRCARHYVAVHQYQQQSRPFVDHFRPFTGHCPNPSGYGLPIR